MKTGKIVKENLPRPLPPPSGNKTSANKRWQPQEHAGKAALNCKGIAKENQKRAEQDEAKDSAISRRKLEFQEKLHPLAGKKIYLDLKGVKQEKKVEENLEKLGATIEKFLSKEIHYFVTNQDKEKLKNDDPSSIGSPSISSPFNSGHTPSPTTFEKKTFTVTRGRAMLQCARMDSAADNIVERAKKLGVKVVPYLSLMKWLIKENSRINERVKDAPPAPPLAKKAKVEDILRGKKLLCKARNLKQPYVKFEAVNKFFRPVQSELKSWPYLNMNSPLGSCPFDDWLLGVNAVCSSKQEPAVTKRKTKQDVGGCWSAESEGQGELPNRPQKMKKKGAPIQAPVQPQVPKTAQGRRLVNWERRKLAEKKLRQGFCECCEMRFEDVKKHFNSTEHAKFVKNETNYRQLDNLIATGYNVQQFVSKVSSHPKLYSENSLSSMEYSSPGRIVLLTLSSSTSTQANPPQASAAGAVITIPEDKPSCQTITSDSESASLEGNAPSVPETQNKTLTPKNFSEQTLNKSTPVVTPCFKTPVKANPKMQSLRQNVSPSLRSPLKCLLNSPSRLDFNATEKQAAKPKGLSVAFPAVERLVSQSSFLTENQEPHSKNVEVGAADNQNENAQPIKFAKCSPPSLENDSAEPNETSENQCKSVCAKTQENSGAATAVVSSAITCFTPPQPLGTNTANNSKSPLVGNSSDSKRASLSFKRNFRCSAGKTKNQRLFKLGEKWQVLSQQSVKKILFSDESPEPFTGFDPKDIFKNSDYSDVSYETVSEVILTDPSEFEWVLGNCEGKRVNEGSHSEPSSQATFFYNSQKNVPTRDPTAADYATAQEKSAARENIFKKYANLQEDRVQFSGEEDKRVRECTELSSASSVNSNRDSGDSESPKNYSDNVEAYSHKDYPPYIPNGQTSGYCSPAFHQTTHIQPALVADDQHYPNDDFDTKVIQDLDYSQTPRYLHLESVGPPPSNCESSFDNPSMKHEYIPNNNHFQQFQYSDSKYPTSLDPRSHNALHNYPHSYDAETMEQSCSQALDPQSPSLEKSQEKTPPVRYSLSDSGISKYRENTPIIGDIGQGKKAVFPETPLPSLSYECSSISVTSVDRTLNQTDQNLDTPPDPPIGTNNNNNINNNNSFEPIPVLNFDSSFNLPVQNFPILPDYTPPPEDDEEKRPSFRDFVPSTPLKAPAPPSTANFKDQENPRQICYNKENAVASNTIGIESTNTNDSKSNFNHHKEFEIRKNFDNRDCDVKKSKCNRYNIDKTTPYVNSYIASPHTVETHSLLSSLSQTAVVLLETSPEAPQTLLKCQQDLPSEAKLSPVSPVRQKGPKPDLLAMPEPVLEKEIPQLTEDSKMHTSLSSQINPPSSARRVSCHQDDDPDMPPHLQLEEQQTPLLVDSQCQLAPPHLSPEEPIKSEQKRRPSSSHQEPELPSLSVEAARDSPLLFSDSSSSSEPPREDGFISLSNITSNFKNHHNLNLNITQRSNSSSLAKEGRTGKRLSSTTAPPLVNDCDPHQKWNTETNPTSISTSYESITDKKAPSIILLSSSSLTSDIPVHRFPSSKSEIEIADSSPKPEIEGMDTSDDAYVTSEGSGSKIDSSAGVKDSGFFSVEELTPKKSPNSDSHHLSLNVRKISHAARPCSVVLEKTPDTQLAPSLRFPLQRAVDQQNTFSVKRSDANETVSPNSKVKPRLLKRLSDNQKTFRLDYIHGHSGGRRSSSSRLWAGKTRSMKQNYRFK